MPVALVKPRGVIFDLDGTLIDSTAAIVHCFHRTFDHFGRPRPASEAIVAAIGATLEDQFRLFWADCDAADCARVYREYYAAVCEAMTGLLPGAREILDACADAGLALGFATSKRLKYAELILQHLGVLGHFTARIGPDEVAHPKPHPEAVERCAAALGLRTTEVFLVGDTHYDVEAGQAAGARVLCVTTGSANRARLEALGPEAVHDSLAETQAYILAQLR